MSQPQDGYPPPPTPSSGTAMQWRRQQSGYPPLIQTVFHRSQAFQPNASLPGSAVCTPISPMCSPLSASLPNASSPMASGTYDPRQWSQTAYAESSHTASGISYPRNTRDSTGMEPSMPSPPPPYTPPVPASTLRPVRPATGNNDLYVASPLATSSSTAGQNSSRSSPQMHMAPHFPPPPSKDKASSQSERDSSRPRFSLSALTSIVKRPDLSEVIPRPSSPLLALSDAPQRLPAGRRAISTGGIGLPRVSTSSCDTSRKPSPESGRWEPGMPLPPPPPGPPPPNTARSRSLNRNTSQHFTNVAYDVSNTSRHRTTGRASHHNGLGAIPPTPAGWTDDDPVPHSRPAMPPVSQLRIESDNTPVTKANLTRRPAIRDPSVDSILERRSKSRAGKDVATLDEARRYASRIIPAHVSNFPNPAKLVLSSTDPLLHRRIAERGERAEQSGSRPESGSGSIGQPSPATVRRQDALRSCATLTPPYTPAAKIRGDKPKRTSSYSAAMATAGSTSDTFVQSSLERFHMFIQQEASSPSNRERLELFANFMVQESRIRRDLYSDAFSLMAGEIMELTRDLWRPNSGTDATLTSHTASGTTQGEFVRVSASPEGSRRSGNAPVESSCSSATDFTPATDTESIYGANCDEDKMPPLTPWGEKFQPSLSPIRSVPSMAVSTVPDEEDSRGRSASRWWEGSGEGSNGHGGRKLEMTKQESKYMSLHPNELAATAELSPCQSTPTPRTMQATFLSVSDEYPPEKIGLHEDVVYNSSFFTKSAPSLLPNQDARGKQPMPPSLDVSRLVTLPPPYPRHFPALHNNHPSLSAIRARHREIASTISTRQNAFPSDASWQPSVYNDMMQGCEASIQELIYRLNTIYDGDPCMTAQTEGDERPEILEELTLLKWIFEAREQLQKQDFDAQMQQLRVRSQVFTDHCLSTGEFQRKAAEEGRLAHHILHSQLAFAVQATNRFSHLLEIVEHHVNRGAEVQLSAFWDIAPSLLEIVQSIPSKDDCSLANLSVLIPSADVAENPSYRRFPLQYLLTTLTHAKKSAYQFIENQTNLLCLLHEVRNAAMSAEIRMVEVKRCAEGEDQKAVRDDMAVLRKAREDEETRILKERVGVLEGQWGLALGEDMERVIDSVEGFLKKTGGWEEGVSG